MSITVSCNFCGFQVYVTERTIASWKCPKCGQGTITAKGTGQIKADKDGSITFRT